MKFGRFFSPWHSVLYGVGHFLSQDLEPFQTRSVQAFIRCVDSLDAFQEQYGSGNSEFDNVLQSATRNRKLTSIDLVRLNKASVYQHAVNVCLPANKLEKILELNVTVENADLTERELYDQIMSFASLLYRVVSDQTLSTVVENWATKYLAVYLRNLLVFKDSFLSARCSSLFCFVLGSCCQVASLQKILKLALEDQATLLIHSERTLLNTQDDGVHLGEDRIVFSGSLLLWAKESLCHEGREAEGESFVRLKALVESYFPNLRVESKASQLTFYLLGIEPCFGRKRQRLCQSVLDDYLNISDKSPYDYLRVVYLLVSMPKSSAQTNDKTYLILESRLIERLSIAFSDGNTRKAGKYSDDFFVYCYSLLVIVSGGSSALGDAFQAATERLNRCDLDYIPEQLSKLLYVYVALIDSTN